MPTTFMVSRDGKSNVAYGLEKPMDIRDVVMLADTETTLVVPDDCNLMLIAAEDTLFWSNEAFALTTSNTFVSTVAEMNAALRYKITAGETLYFRSPRSQRVSVGFYTSSNVPA